MTEVRSGHGKVVAKCAACF